MPINNSSILHVHSMYSISDSTATPLEICERAKELGIENVTLTDHGTLLGIEPFMDAGRQTGVNTIPGVEGYYTTTAYEGVADIKKAHLILVAKNYKGYQDICYAMRDANAHNEKVRKQIYPIIDDEIIEKYLKDNENIIVTSACAQGPIAKILLSNYYKREKLNKEQAICEEYKGIYEEYEQANKDLAQVTEDIRSLKKKRTENSKYTKEGFLKKLNKCKDKLESLENMMFRDESGEYQKTKEEYEEYLRLRTEALEFEESADSLIKAKEDRKASLKGLIDAAKPGVKIYQKAKSKIDEIPLEDENELYSKAKKLAETFKSMFPNFFVEIQNHGLELEAKVMPELVKIARELEIPLIAANDAHMVKNDENSIEARRIVRYNYFDKSQEVSDSDRELYIKTNEEILAWLEKIVDKDAAREAVDNVAVLETCKVVFPEESHYPSVGGTETIDSVIAEARQKKIEEGLWNDEYEKRLTHEMEVIKTMGYVDYHMVVRDFCRMGRILGVIPKYKLKEIPEDFSKVEEWIRENDYNVGVGIGPGRGSAAGSLVCYLLGITNIDPLKYNLLFERFLNPERVSMPDIDTDVKKCLRGTIIRYLKWKYGEKAVCSIATETTYAPRGAIQMAGRERAAQLYQGKCKTKNEENELRRRYMYEKTLKISDLVPEDPYVKLKDCEEIIKDYIKDDVESNIIYERAKLLEGKISSTGIHAGGVVISDNDNINDYVPLAYVEEENVWVAQCDMIKLEEKGLLKMDLLGLNTLDCISDCLGYIKKYHGLEINMDKIPFEEEVFKNIYATGNTNSVFQFASPGMKQMLMDFKPTCFEDLILLVACYRPGPMQYLENIIAVKNGKKALTYKTPQLEPILKATYGATVYQEQVMQIFQNLAGYSLGGADLVRRAMSKKKEEKLKKERKAFIYGDPERNIDGCVKRGIDEAVANELFDEMMDFAKYAFNKSHAAAYSLVSYQTAWLKYHYPVEFQCAMLNNKEQDDFAPMVEDCRMSGIKILQPDINRSYYDFVVEDGCIRYGMKGIAGLGEANKVFTDRMCEIRKEGAYTTIEDFYKRNLLEGEKKTFIPKSVCNIFTECGMFDSLGYNRKDIYASEEIGAETYDGAIRLIDNLGYKPALKDSNYNLSKEIELLGMIVSEHPLDGYKDDEKYQCTPMSQLTNGNVSIFGFVSEIKATRSKKGNPMMIMTVQGKTGNCRVYVMGRLYDTYINNDISYKVIKIEGEYRDGSVFAKKISRLKCEENEYYAELDTEEKVNAMITVMNNHTEDGSNHVRLSCHYAGKPGALRKVARPMLAERNLTDREMNQLKINGVTFQKWK